MPVLAFGFPNATGKPIRFAGSNGYIFAVIQN